MKTVHCLDPDHQTNLNHWKNAFCLDEFGYPKEQTAKVFYTKGKLNDHYGEHELLVKLVCFVNDRNYPLKAFFFKNNTYPLCTFPRGDLILKVVDTNYKPEVVNAFVDNDGGLSIKGLEKHFRKNVTSQLLVNLRHHHKNTGEFKCIDFTFELWGEE